MGTRPAGAGFDTLDGQLHCEGVSIAKLAVRFGTPIYVYSRAAITAAYRAYAEALAGRASLVCYAMKANSNLAVLNVLARLGAGFDIVSGGELARVLAAGGAASKVVFSGVGKSEAEIEQALAVDILLEIQALCRGRRPALGGHRDHGDVESFLATRHAQPVA